MSLQTIKHEFALEFGFKNWNELTQASSKPMLQNHMNDIARRYAFECVKASLEKAADNATAYIPFEGEPPSVAKGSIIDRTNIVML